MLDNFSTKTETVFYDSMFSEYVGNNCVRKCCKKAASEYNRLSMQEMIIFNEHLGLCILSKP